MYWVQTFYKSKGKFQLCQMAQISKQNKEIYTKPCAVIIGCHNSGISKTFQLGGPICVDYMIIRSYITIIRQHHPLFDQFSCSTYE